MAGEPGFTLANPTLASGGGKVGCGEFAMTFTIGEAVVGAVAAGQWRMVIGFPATIPDPPPLPDSIFRSGFEAVVTTTAVATGVCAP